MKKILYITTSYILKSSSAAIRNNSLVKGLVELGYEVDVYTIKWPEELSSSFFLQEKNGNIHFTELSNLKMINRMKHVGTINSSRFIKVAISKIRKFVKQIVFFPDECSQWVNNFAYEIGKEYDCVITSSDHKTSHFIGFRLKKMYPNINWIQIWGDPWVSDVNTFSILKKRISFNEEKLLNLADNIVFVSLATHREMVCKFPKYEEKMFYIPRGYYLSENLDKSPTNKVRIIYTGAISFGRDILPLLNGLSQFDNINIEIIVYGDIDLVYREKISKFAFVKIFDSVDYENIMDIYASASILLYLSNKKGTTQIPGKLYDYMGTTKPILCLVEDNHDDISSFLSNITRCLVLKNESENIVHNIDKILKLAFERFPVDEIYSPRSIAKQVEKILN